MLKNSSVKFLFLYLFTFCFLSSSYAQFDKKQYEILGVTVVGNKSADASTIIVNSGLKTGTTVEIPGEQTLNAIKRLWALNIFSDVQIVIDKIVGNGAFLQIKVTEYPRLEEVVFDGNDDVSDKDINEKVSLNKGQTLKPRDIYNTKSTVLKLYREEGLLNAEINPKIYLFENADTIKNKIKVNWRNEKDFSDRYQTETEIKNVSRTYVNKIKERILLKFDIKEGKKVTVRKIEFNGNQAFSDDDLKDAFDKTSEKRWWKFWNRAKLNSDKFEEDKKLLVDFYRKNGYRDFEVLSDTVLYFNDNQDARIVVNVYEGPQYKVRNINWEGNTVYPDDVLNLRLGFEKGDVFNYEKFTRNLRGPNEKQTDVAALYVDNGYLNSNFRPTETVVAEDSIDISIQVIENNRFKIGKVEIQGNDKTIEKVVRRELYTLPGDYFRRSLIFTSLQQLANLQYFNVEKIYTEGIDYYPVSDSTVDLTYKVEEKSSDYLNASVGYSGAFGFSGALGITLTNFSLKHPFQLGGGQVLNFNWQFGVGNYYRTFTFGFTEPWLYDTPTSLGFDVFDTRQVYYFDLRQYGGTLRLGRRLKWPDRFFNLSGFLKYQNNDIREGQRYYAEGKTQQFTLGTTLNRRNIDNPIFPSQGSSFVLDGEISGGAILPGDLNYYKIQFKSEWYKRLFNTSRVALYTSADLGYLNEFDQFTRNRINPFEKFFMGGNGMVIATLPLRGYEDRSVGPKDDGSAIGGRIYSKYTMEIRGALAMEPIPIYLLAFAEAGNVFENLSHDTDLFNLKRSVGLGARIMINPIGLIGFDYGYGFDRISVDGKDNQWIFHFQFGRGF